ncbi:MAG: cyclic nucleotide-binding domain-containing protein [Phaeodactylibacter sp.]|nr:cyclic nucleotide-binding domain-containing protein [Phaeodactylibacter sp.]
MQVLPKTSALIQQLKTFEPFENVPEDALDWLLEKSICTIFEPGDFIFKPNQPADHMLIILEGEYAVQFPRDGELQEIGKYGGGHITGVLPFSRMKESKAFGRVLKTVHAMGLHRDYFAEMVNVSYLMTQNLVGLMSNRIRDLTGQQYQNEKLLSLGKLSAGLAHELNNPASAMVRSAKDLRGKLKTSPEKFKSVMALSVTSEQIDQVIAALFEKIKEGPEDDRSTLEKSQMEDEMLDWLEDQGIEDAEDIAETFSEYNLGEEDLEDFKAIVGSENLSPILRWIENTLSLECLVEEISEASDRIARLIRSIKTYSHMDRGTAMEPTNIHDGIISTLIMLKYKIKQKQIQLVKSFDHELPLFPAYVGDLNQVWTNLIDNALYAMEPGGTLNIRTYRDRHFICVEITDSGKGIPQDVITRIFDPFFTTKKIGEGTGMGLDIVKKIITRHRGDIKVTSEPGQTTFMVCLPTQKLSVPQLND